MKEEIIKCDYCKEVITNDKYIRIIPNEQYGSIDIDVMTVSSKIVLSFGDFCGIDCLCNYIRSELGYGVDDE